MKRIKLFFIFLLVIILLPITSCRKEKSNKLVIAEVTHSLFYAPLYIAKEKGIFDNYGIDIEIITTPGADKVMGALLSKDADIGLMGPEATVYVYLNGQKDYAVNFAQLTRTDGSFLLGRDKIDDFTFDILKGKTIIGGRKGGMPEMVLEYVLKQNGLSITQNNQDPTCDVNIRTDVSFDVMTGVFVKGESDFVTAFEPNGTSLEKANKGYIITSLGEHIKDDIPYTCFSTLKSNINRKEELLQKFTHALMDALLVVNSNDSEYLSSFLKESFPTSTKEELISVLNNYKAINAWPTEMNFTKESFDTLIDIVKLAKELDQSVVVPYDDLVTTNFIEKKSI